MIALLAAVLLAATMSNGMPTAPPTPVMVPAPAAGEPNGQNLYELHCISCHGGDFNGVAGRGPTLKRHGLAAIDFYLATGRMPYSVPGVESERQDAHPLVLTPDERVAIERYYTSRVAQPGTPIPQVDPAHGDIVRGRNLFTTDCQQCHGSRGYGATVGYGWIAPAILPDTPVEIAEAVRIGPGQMPNFDERHLSSRDLNDLLAYIETFGDRHDNPGGISTASVGPVGEGALAFIFGLGIPLLVMLAVGTRLGPETPEGPSEVGGGKGA